MNILLLGGGGREHAMARSLAKSKRLNQLYIAPGNAGTSQHGTNIPLDILDFDIIKSWSQDKKIDMIIVGPEAPLVEGIYDVIKGDETTKHIAVIGPSSDGAMLEGSKSFAKKFMSEFNIPTAAYLEVTKDNLKEGINYLSNNVGPYVLKADGLAAGKGVLIIDDTQEAINSLKVMLAGQFGQASAIVVIEQFLDGIEFSVFALTDGKDYVILPVAKDYKRIGEGDTGLNTGGMGAVSPPPFVTDELMQKVENRIVKPTIEGISKRGFDYVGFVFIGLIRVNNEPYVIEYNCRMGDPETEVVFPRIQSDVVDLMEAASRGTLEEVQIDINPLTAAAVMLVSGGYPEVYQKEKFVTNIPTTYNSIIFHAGTKMEDEKIMTNGGRVIAITSFGEDHKVALDSAKKIAEEIQFEGKYYRKDIGFDL
ncbi:MAG TPA: phosphoribosylamine--glycine ligase [Saprospirales bacterium]|jgi:phosphoribosylamine--glycine ligase|nr:phosphoribosylamine--glycine ligase [Saprospiraceae bacterium]MDB9891707.1 phosphoribosylamine--glycine ligase [bacterium]HAW05035.1 phosphoribosylamine--glycine ligase [Saprospirales bacterium]